MVACRSPLQESLLWFALGPALLVFLWISTGLILANLVFGRIQGRRRLAVAFAYSALILMIVCVGVFHLENKLAQKHPAYHGP